jgi:16S rRNA (adenine1518-N6/adenine1519-N6)-dimethyltransferase
VFLPRPNVESSLVEVVRHDRHVDAGVDVDLMFSLVRAGFAKRRKMLRGALAGTAGAAALEAAGIAGTARAEELDVEDWISLARAAGSRQ